MEFEGLKRCEASRLYELDRTHWLHPQGDLDAPAGSVPQLIFAGGRGTTLADIDGREYIDGMASLWNVNVGYGRTVLADAAAEQMKTLAFSSAYGGYGTAPAIKLDARRVDEVPHVVCVPHAWRENHQLPPVESEKIDRALRLRCLPMADDHFDDATDLAPRPESAPPKNVGIADDPSPDQKPGVNDHSHGIMKKKGSYQSSNSNRSSKSLIESRPSRGGAGWPPDW